MAWTDKLAEMLRLNDGEQAYVGYPQMQVGLNKPRQAGYATGFLEGATGMDSMQPKNPITDPNFSAYEQGKNTGEAVGIGAMALPAYAMALRAGAPKAYNALENYMVKSGGMIPLEAYHGTPHNIQGKFDINKVGTGEGAQAYGHGMYFAEAPEVAGQYKTALSNIELSAKGKPLTELGIDERIATHSPTIFKNPLDYGLAEYNKSLKTQYLDYPDLKKDLNFPKELFDQRIDFLKSWGKGTTEAKAAEAMQDFVKKHGYPDVNVSGNLYKVDIPDEYIPNMLDWDKPLSQQPKSVQKALEKLDPDLYSAKGMDYDPSELGQSIYYRLRNTAKDKINQQIVQEKQALLDKYGAESFQKSKMSKEDNAKFHELLNKEKQAIQPSQVQVSELLNSLGVKGIRYLDEGSRAKGGTSNFVVFDPTEVKILEKNSKPISRKDLIEEQVNKLKD